MCSPAENLSPGRFPDCVTLGMNPELSVAVGGVHVTVADMVPRSAVEMIFNGQLEKVGPETSPLKKVIIIIIIIIKAKPIFKLKERDKI